MMADGPPIVSSGISVSELDEYNDLNFIARNLRGNITQAQLRDH